MADPVITFGTSAVFGTQTGWTEQGSTTSATSDRAAALNGEGNEILSELYNAGTEYSQEYVASSSATPATIPASIGKLYGSAILTSIAISTSGTDFPKMTLSGHNHTDAAHTDTLHQAAHGIAMSVAFGSQDFLGGTAGDNAVVQSSSVTITCQHNDTLDADGNHLAGENFNGQISGTTTYYGVPTTAADASWDITSINTTSENSGYTKTVVTAKKSVSLASPA